MTLTHICSPHDPVSQSLEIRQATTKFEIDQPRAARQTPCTLPVGSNFYDSTAGVRFTTLAAGGTEPNQFIDVKIDFDSRLELQSTNIIVDEAVGNAALVVTRGFDTSGACAISFNTVGNTATSGVDFHATSGTLNWADGDSSSRTIYVPIRPDSSVEGSETFTLTLSSPLNAVAPPSRSMATITILDAGRRVPDFASGIINSEVEIILPLDDGRILVGGNLTTGVTGSIARFYADGSEDPTFVKGLGFAGASPNRVSSIVRQSDGKLLIGGDFTSYNGTSCNRISRIGPDGLVDTSFCAAIGTGPNARVHSVAVQADGKIIIGGEFTAFNSVPAPGIVRLLPIGMRDSAAPIDITFQSSNSVVRKILVQELDQKIMIVGSFIGIPRERLQTNFAQVLLV